MARLGDLTSGHPVRRKEPLCCGGPCHSESSPEPEKQGQGMWRGCQWWPGLRTPGFGGREPRAPPHCGPFARWQGPALWPPSPRPSPPREQPRPRDLRACLQGRAGSRAWAGTRAHHRQTADPALGASGPAPLPWYQECHQDSSLLARHRGVVCSSLPNTTWIIPILLTRGSERLMDLPRLTRRRRRAADSGDPRACAVSLSSAPGQRPQDTLVT